MIAIIMAMKAVKTMSLTVVMMIVHKPMMTPLTMKTQMKKEVKKTWSYMSMKMR